ncbi:MAG: right-handed parallel beta-helix repeat-containing protein, partial [Bacteroidales bacterium]|nr:right-handed parallel beta-helix repeat-containing protein [Bacteroidales bacterium]
MKNTLFLMLIILNFFANAQNSGQFTISLIVTDENDSTGILIKENYITIFETIIDSGDVSGIWTFNNSPYLINGNINIPLGQELMIEPGVIIVFNGHYKFSVFGRLIAQANQVDSIFIIPLYEDIGWEGIWFQNTSTNNQDSSMLKYCHIEGVRYPLYTYLDYSGGIVCNYSGDIIIQNCLITNNHATCHGGGITLLNNSGIIIRKNTITNNKTGLWDYWSGGGIYIYNSNAIVIENLISYNKAWFGGGISCGFNSSAIIKNNIISFNNGREYGGGIYIYMTDLILERNLISHNSFGYSGGGISIIAASIVFVNNTITNNYHNGVWFGSGGGIYCSYNVDLHILNTIIWDNYPYEICLGNASCWSDNFVGIIYSDVKDGQNNIQIFSNGYVDWGWNNITSYPLFI